MLITFNYTKIMSDIRSNDCNQLKQDGSLTEKTFSDTLCNELFQAILVHDDIHPNAKLPDNIHLDYSQQQLHQCYNICKQLWYQGVNRSEITEITQKFHKNGHLNTDDKLAFKYIRAKFKHLRFAYFSYSYRHRYPLLFHTLTRYMGLLQDAVTNNQTTSLNRILVILKILLSKFIYALIQREINRFQLASPDSFKKYIKSEMEFLKYHLLKAEITSKEFHEMRKVISRLVALYDNLKTLFPSDYHNNISYFLSTTNGMMGSIHDELITLKYQKSSYYYKDTFKLHEDIRVRLVTLIKAYSRLI